MCHRGPQRCGRSIALRLLWRKKLTYKVLAVQWFLGFRYNGHFLGGSRLRGMADLNRCGGKDCRDPADAVWQVVVPIEGTSAPSADLRQFIAICREPLEQGGNRFPIPRIHLPPAAESANHQIGSERSG